MNPEFYELLGKIAPGVIAAPVASWFTVRLALGRYKKEIFWQRKLDAYTRILDALHVCRLRAERLANESIHDTSPTDEQKAEMKKKYSAASSELYRIIDTGLLILPEQATVHLNEVMSPRYEDWKELSSYEFWNTEENLIKKALTALIAVARVDLKQ